MTRFLDSSVLVRYLTNDDPRRSPIADQIIESDDLAVTTLILHEVSHVLRKAYGYGRVEIVEALVQFLQRENVSLVDGRKELVAVALRKAQAGRLSLGDALIIAQMRGAGYTEIYSFDRGFTDEGIRVLEEAGH